MLFSSANKLRTYQLYKMVENTNQSHVAAETAERAAPELTFTTSNGGPIRPDNLRGRFLYTCKRAGIEPHEDGRPWGVHELRHYVDGGVMLPVGVFGLMEAGPVRF